MIKLLIQLSFGLMGLLALPSFAQTPARCPTLLDRSVARLQDEAPQSL
ncbi:MAG: hypothetical protein RJA44_2212, partial [Pseudomonadota bacterium]